MSFLLVGGALADGYQARLFDFENFERKFEETISETAVKTKFEQHSKEGMQIVEHLRSVMDEIHQAATKKR
ncbi:mitofusin-2-like [Saccoglossus kowalevskii]